MILGLFGPLRGSIAIAVNFYHFREGPTEMHKIIEILLLLLDALLIDLGEAHLSHQELPPLFFGVALSLCPRRHGIALLEQITSDV